MKWYDSRGIGELYIIAKAIAPKLPYHNIDHLIEVSNLCMIYGLWEGLNSKEIFVLGRAGLLHDIVYVPGRDDNEEKSIDVSKAILLRLGYSSEEIAQISNLILITKFPTNPKNILEKIICDSDLDHLWRDDFIEQSELLRQELGISKKRWYNEIEPTFLSQVKYYTSFAKKLRDAKLKENLKKLKKLNCS